MSTLDRYIARQYLFNVGALLVLLLSFVVTVDVALNMERFIDAAEARSHGVEGIGRFFLAVGLVADLWWPRLLQLFNFLLGLILIGAMGFTLAQLVRHRELVAIMAGGLSLRRVARPVLIVALAMTALQAVNQEFIVPRIAPLLQRDHGDAGLRDLRSFEVSLTSDNFGRLFYARRFDPEGAERRGSLEDVRIWERDDQGRAIQRIDSPRATWTGSAWRLESPETFSLKMAAPATTPARARPADTLLVPTGLDPAALMLRHYENFSQSLSYSQIATLLRSPNLEPRLRDKLERVRFGRLSTMLTSVLSLIISLPFFLTREPKNMVLQSLKCAPVGLGSLLGGVLCAAAPIPGLPAPLVALLPVLVLICIAVAATGMLRT